LNRENSPNQYGSSESVPEESGKGYIQSFFVSILSVKIKNSIYAIQLRIRDSKIHKSFFIPSVLGEIAMRIRGRKAMTSNNTNSAVPIVPNILTSL
jgi:hypothetical protein